RAAARQSFSGLPSVATVESTHASTSYLRSEQLPPNRQALPVLSRYRYEEVERRLGENIVVGNVETTRGCRFSCLYCSVFAASRTKVVLQHPDVVRADIDQLVEMGARHICFVDAEFQNFAKHALVIVKTLRDRHPQLSFDFTSRADLLAE